MESFGLHLLLKPVPVSRAPARATRSALLASRASTAGRLGAAPTAGGKTSKHKLVRLLPPARHRGHDMRQRTHERTGRHHLVVALPCPPLLHFTLEDSRSVAFTLIHVKPCSPAMFSDELHVHVQQRAISVSSVLPTPHLLRLLCHVFSRVACPCPAASHFSEPRSRLAPL